MAQMKGARSIPLDRIREPADAPRRYFDKGPLDELTASIAANGVVQPILVVKAGRQFRLVAGQRRLRAARAAGLTSIPAVVLSASEADAATIALLENMFRRDLNCIEQAEAIDALIRSCGLTQRQAAERLQLSEPAISNKLRVLALDPTQRAFAARNGLTERHLRAILRLPPQQWSRVMERCAARGLSVAACEQLVSSLLEKKGRTRAATLPIVKDVRLFFNTIEHAVDVMRRTGIDASATRADRADYIEYTIKIPLRRQTG